MYSLVCYYGTERRTYVWFFFLLVGFIDLELDAAESLKIKYIILILIDMPYLVKELVNFQFPALQCIDPLSMFTIEMCGLLRSPSLPDLRSSKMTVIKLEILQNSSVRVDCSKMNNNNST